MKQLGLSLLFAKLYRSSCKTIKIAKVHLENADNGKEKSAFHFRTLKISEAERQLFSGNAALFLLLAARAASTFGAAAPNRGACGAETSALPEPRQKSATLSGRLFPRLAAKTAFSPLLRSSPTTNRQGDPLSPDALPTLLNSSVELSWPNLRISEVTSYSAI